MISLSSFKKQFFIGAFMLAMVVPEFAQAQKRKYSKQVMKMMIINDAAWEVIIPCLAYAACCVPQTGKNIDFLSFNGLCAAMTVRWLGSYPQASIQHIIDKYVDMSDDENDDSQNTRKPNEDSKNQNDFESNF